MVQPPYQAGSEARNGLNHGDFPSRWHGVRGHRPDSAPDRLAAPGASEPAPARPLRAVREAVAEYTLRAAQLRLSCFSKAAALVRSPLDQQAY